jgi:hypothetical protein
MARRSMSDDYWRRNILTYWTGGVSRVISSYCAGQPKGQAYPGTFASQKNTMALERRARAGIGVILGMGAGPLTLHIFLRFPIQHHTQAQLPESNQAKAKPVICFYDSVEYNNSRAGQFSLAWFEKGSRIYLDTTCRWYCRIEEYDRISVHN